MTSNEIKDWVTKRIALNDERYREELDLARLTQLACHDPSSTFAGFVPISANEIMSLVMECYRRRVQSEALSELYRRL